jgi:hypothetical protein
VVVADSAEVVSAISVMMDVKNVVIRDSAVAVEMALEEVSVKVSVKLVSMVVPAAVVVGSASVVVSPKLVADSIKMVEDKVVVDSTDAVSVRPAELVPETKELADFLGLHFPADAMPATAPRIRKE